MKWINHQIATGFIVYAATDDALFVASSIMGAVIPDKVEGSPPRENKAYWNWRRNHRTWSHYPPIYFALIAALQFAKNYYPNPTLGIFLNVLTYVLIGALLHIAEDGICGKVPIFKPRKKYGVKLFKVGSWQEYFFVTLIICGCLLFRFGDVFVDEFDLREKLPRIDINLGGFTLKSYSYTPERVCSKQINFSIDDEGKLHDVKFFGGCPGNLVAISTLVEGQDAKKTADLLRGNPCGARGTSCADQFAKAIDEAIAG